MSKGSKSIDQTKPDPTFRKNAPKGDLGMIKQYFDDYFSTWDIRLPKEDVANRARGKIVSKGWAIWYLFDKGERGEFLDFYAAHRMTNDRHMRIHENGTSEGLPELFSWRRCSTDPEEDARFAEELRSENEKVAKILEDKGFGVTGDEPGGVLINRYLTLSQCKPPSEKGRRRT